MKTKNPLRKQRLGYEVENTSKSPLGQPFQLHMQNAVLEAFFNFSVFGSSRTEFFISDLKKVGSPPG